MILRRPSWFLTAALAALLAGCAAPVPRDAAPGGFTDGVEPEKVFDDGAEKGLVARDASGRPLPPVADRVPHVVASPHGDREDPYYWLRDDTRTNPKMLAWLEAENAYKQAMLAHTEALSRRSTTRSSAG